MKKIINLIYILLLVFITVIIVIYISNYKTFEEMLKLQEKGASLKNVYAERYIKNESFNSNSQLKDYRVDIYWKDNVLIYKDIRVVDYYDFNTNQYFIIMNNEKVPLNVEKPPKFNEYLFAEDVDQFSYKYLFPIRYNDCICDVIQLSSKSNNTRKVLYIDQITGLIMKEEFIGLEKCIFEYKYKFNMLTDNDLQIENFFY